MASRRKFAVASGGPSSPLFSRQLQAVKNALSTVQRMDMRCQRGGAEGVPRGGPGLRRPAAAIGQFLSTMRPTTLPARNSSIHFWTSPIGSSRIGVGLILPARASAISSWASASVPTMKPSTVMRL